MNIKIQSKGELKNTFKFLERATDIAGVSLLDRYAQMGVDALAAATPVDTGKTASSWTYKITKNQNEVKIEWTNTNSTSTGIPIVVLLQYGHGTRNGGYVQGRDFINPAIRPVFDNIAKHVWEEVVK